MRSTLVKPLAALLGLALIAGYFVQEAGVSRGAFEFAYYPVTNEPLPYASMRGFTYEQLYNHVWRFALLAPGLLLLSWGISGLFRRFTSLHLEPRRAAMWVAGLSVSLVAGLMLLVLRMRAFVTDELIYSMQAQFFTEGHWVGPKLAFTPLDGFTVTTLHGYTGKYLPGEGLVQVLGVLLHAPPLLHIPIVALTLWAFYRAVASAADASVAAIAVAVLGLSPMYLLTSATGLSNTTSLACVVLAGLGYEWVRTGREKRGAVLVAVALGYCAATRPQVALPVSAVVGAFTAWTLIRRRSVVALLLLAAFGGCGLAALGLYNHAVTGSATKLPWFSQCYAERVGFGQVTPFDTYRHTPLHGLENLAVVAVRFNAWWLGLPFALGILVVWWLVGRPARGLALWAGVGLAVVVFEFFYYTTGVSDTGPIYHYELLLPGAVLFANTLRAAYARWPAATLATLTVHAALGSAPFLVEQSRRMQRMLALAHDDAEHTLATLQTPAIVLYETWDNEQLPVGWTDAFPKRWRRQQDPIVTYPRPPAKYVQSLLAAYPGRHCYYYHRNHRSRQVELLACDQAGSYLQRVIVNRTEEGALFTPSTAYSKTPFNPFEANRGRRARGTDGKLLVSCCVLAEMRLGGEPVPADEPCAPEL